MDEYLNAKSMLAPGAAGASTTMIAGTLASQFGLPGSYTALIVSFLFGLIVFSDKTVPLLQRLLFYVVNSMIIFTVAVGLNTAGAAATRTDTDTLQARQVEPENRMEAPFFHPWF